MGYAQALVDIKKIDGEKEDDAEAEEGVWIMSESKIKTIVEVDASQLDETIKKAEKLISLLEKANSLINELANKGLVLR